MLNADPLASGSSVDLTARLKATLDDLTRAIGAEGGWLALLDDPGSDVLRSGTPPAASKADARAGDAAIVTRVLAERRLTLMDGDEGSLLAIPLESSSDLLGVLVVTAPSQRVYSAADVYEITAAAARIGALIDPRRPAHEAGQVVRGTLLLEAAETVNSSLDSPSLEVTILAEATRLAGARKSALLISRGDVLVAQEVQGLSDRARRRFVVPLEGSVFGRSMLTGEALAIEDLASALGAEQSLFDVASICDGECRSIMVAPLQSHRATYGVLALLYAEPRRFGDDEKAVLRTFAIHAAIALDNRRLMQEKERMAMRDGLTDVYNRAYLELAMERTAKDLRRNGGTASVLFLDVDGMKEVNDTYGHPAGDALLSTLAGLLQRSCRDTDVVARYGGDEFVVLMPGTDEDGARAVRAQRDRHSPDPAVGEHRHSQRRGGRHRHPASRGRPPHVRDQARPHPPRRLRC